MLYGPDTVLSTLTILSKLIVITSLYGKYYSYPNLTDEESQAQRGQTACPRSHS